MDLRAGLLEGVTMAVAGDAQPTKASAALGARVAPLAVDLGDEEALAAAISALPVPDVLVCATGELDGAFLATRAVANAWIAGRRSGRVVLVAPPHDAPAGAALENLARTLSVEWARYGITPTAILPAAGAEQAVAFLVAFLASPAGAYYSGCAFRPGAG